MPFIVIGEKDYSPSEAKNKTHSMKHSGGAPTAPPGGIKTPMKKSSNPSRSKPGDGKK